MMEPVDWILLAICLGVATLPVLAAYHLVAGYYHYRYYVRRRHEPEKWKCQPNRFLTHRLHRQAIVVGSGNLTLGGLVTGTLAYGIASGQLQTPIYLDVAEYGWTYTLGMTVVLFVMVDYLNYWVHRLVHTPFLYRRIHRAHHRYVATTPYVATALHPVELLAQQGVSLFPLFFIPFHAASIVIVLLYILIYNVVDHSGVRLVSIIPWQPPSTYHDDHHANFHVNFGQHLMIWDRLHGTLRRTDRRYGQDVFGGKGLPDHDTGGSQSEFVRY